MPVTIETASVKSRTYGSMPISVERGRLSGAAARTRLVPQRASSKPIAAAPRDSRTLSVNNWRTMRPRSAPSAVRMANSRLRAVERASSKLATLAQAMISTNPTAPTSSSSVDWMYPTMSSFMRTSLRPMPGIRLRILAGQDAADGRHLRLRRFHGHARLEPANDLDSRVRLPRAQQARVILLDRNVDLRVLAEPEIGGQDADHGATHGVERQDLAEDVRVGCRAAVSRTRS